MGIYMSLFESGEMYLETIHILSQKSGDVRAVDICAHMGFSKPSVSRAISNLKKDGYVVLDSKSHISLTDSGREIADKIYERHNLLKEFLTRLGVDEETAAEDACKIEHHISNSSFEAIKNHIIKNKKD